MSIVVVGSVAFDSIETPRGSVERAVGGSAVYFSIAASCFVPVKLVAVVGEDFEASHRSILEEKGIDLEGLAVVPGGKTFFWHGRYREAGAQGESLRTELNVFENFHPELPGSYRGSAWLFLANIDPDVQLRVLDQAADRPLVGADTVSLWIRDKRPRLLEVLRRIDILFVNDVEARELSGERGLVQAARAILSLGPRAVVIKKGEHGAFLFTPDFRFYAPAYPLQEVVDTTGAGDSFAGGFMGSLALSSRFDEGALRRAMVYGAVTGSFACEDFSIGSIRCIDERRIRERFAELVDLVRIDLESE